MNAESAVRSEDEGTDVEASAAACGNPVGINFNECLNSIYEKVGRNLGHAQTLVGFLHTLCVLFGAEEVNRTVCPLISLHAFKNFLCIVQNHAAGVHGDGAVGDNSSVKPTLAFLIVHEEHMVGEMLTEAESGEIGLFFGLSSSGDGKFHFVTLLPFLSFVFHAEAKCVGIHLESVLMTGGNYLSESVINAAGCEVVNFFHYLTGDYHVCKAGHLVLVSHGACGDVVDIDVGSIYLAVNESGVYENAAAGKNDVFITVERGKIHNNESIGSVNYGRADGFVAYDNAAVCGAAAHFGTVRGEPGNFLTFQHALVCEELASEENALTAEACKEDVYAFHLPASSA